MQPAEIPENEADRLASLHSLHILDALPDERFDRVTRLAERLFGVDIALVSLVDTDQLWFKSAVGFDAQASGREMSFCDEAIQQNGVFVIEDAQQDVRFADSPMVTGAPFARFYAGCPIRSPDGHTIGTLCLIDPVPRSFVDNDRACLRDLACIIENELLLLSETTRDPLTRINNRRGFEMCSEQMLHVAERDKLDVKLAYFDLDGFKQVNDEWGHEAGDEVLREFTGLLNRTFRKTDVIARLGGDEFVVLMLGRDLDTEAALQRLAAWTDEKNEELDGNILWSVGLVEYRAGDHDSINELMAEADQRMYEHKEARRRQVA